jgi:hypothetical protein
MKAQYFKGKVVDDRAAKVCVLFDPKDGRIVHVHGVTKLDGTNEIDEKELERRAIGHAKAFGHEVATLKALQVPISAMRQPGALKVNPAGSGLVQTSAPIKWSDFAAERRKRR